MSTGTGIEWTDATWNPTKGCTIVSPGCTHCYAMRMAARLEAMGQEKYTGLTVKKNGHAVWNGKMTLDEDSLSAPLGWKKPRRVFVNSMSDLFHEGVPFEFVAKVHAVMLLAQWHTFQVLTKRPERAVEYYDWLDSKSDGDSYGLLVDIGRTMFDRDTLLKACNRPRGESVWPLQNLWLGTSVEDQARADERIPHLLRCPAAVRFLSAEPLLGAMDLAAVSIPEQRRKPRSDQWPFLDVLRGSESPGPGLRDAKIHWVIAGGESGPGARPMQIEWARSIVQQCKAAGVSCFVKQLGANPVASVREVTGDDDPDDENLDELKLEDRKGGDINEWPEDLRVREFPVLSPAGQR